MNIYLKIDSILEQMNKRFDARYDVTLNKDGYSVKVKQPIEFVGLPQFNECLGELPSIKEGVFIMKQDDDSLVGYLDRNYL